MTPEQKADFFNKMSGSLERVRPRHASSASTETGGSPILGSRRRSSVRLPK
jgi:hypothetical protein